MSLSTKKRILIISLTGGFGHLRAGQALFDYAKENLSDIEVKCVDMINIDKSFKKYVFQFYTFFSKKFPLVWKIIYNQPLIFLAIKKIIAWRGFFNKKVQNYILQENPDIIIFTNVVVLPMFISSCRKKLANTLMALVITDYHGHPYYRIDEIDYYFVANGQVSEDLQLAGVQKEKIFVTGIPIHPRFYKKENINQLRKKHGFKNNFPVVLVILSFCLNEKKLKKLINDLLYFQPPVNVAAITNKNQKFYNILNRSFASNNVGRIKIIEWTDIIDEYMKIAKVVITKAGGLTVSECLTLKKNMIMVNLIPGQEEKNAEFVQKNNFGIKVNNVEQITSALPKMLSRTVNIKKEAFLPVNSCREIFNKLIKK